MDRPHFILASASPRRLQLLQQVGLVPDEVIPAECDETPLKNELPTHYAVRIARAKADRMAGRFPDAVILSADTVVAVGRRILPKAENAAQAKKCLELLSGRRHRVYTAVCIKHKAGYREILIMTHVRFRRLSAGDIKAYVELGEWEGKAGGYAIQGAAAAFIPSITGSVSNVIGLPLCETVQLLAQLGVK